MRHAVFLFFLLIALACSKSDSITPSNELVGSWRLTNYCQPTSSSACTSINVPSTKHVIVAFENDGEFNEYYENTKPNEYSFLGCGSGSYSIEGSNIRIIAVCMSSTQGKLMQLVSVNRNQLVLNPFGSGEYIFVRQ